MQSNEVAGRISIHLEMKRPKRSIYKLLYYINIIILFSVYILINRFRVTMHFLESSSSNARSSVQIHGYLQGAIRRIQFRKDRRRGFLQCSCGYVTDRVCANLHFSYNCYKLICLLIGGTLSTRTWLMPLNSLENSLFKLTEFD